MLIRKIDTDKPIDLHNESKDEWYRVFADKDDLYTMLNNAEKGE